MLPMNYFRYYENYKEISGICKLQLGTLPSKNSFGKCSTRKNRIFFVRVWTVYVSNQC